MTKIQFGLESKQRLAAALAGSLVESNSALTLGRGRDELRIEFTGYMEGERRLGFRIRSGLERAEKQGAGAGYRQDPRPRLDGQPELLLRRETAKDRKGKRWGLNREVQTADPAFDELVYVQSDAPDEHLQAVLGSAETRRIIKTLLEHHCESVGINKEDFESLGNNEAEGELTVVFRTYEPDEASLPGLAEQLKWEIEEFRSLRASLPLFVGDGKAVRKFWRVKWAYRIELLVLLAGVVFGILAEGTIEDWHTIRLLVAGLAAAVLFVPVAFLLARGHARGVAHFRGLALLSLLVFPFSAMGLGLGTNTLFDTSPPQTHRLLVVGNPKCSHDQEFVAVQHHRDKRRSFNVGIKGRACYAAKLGKTVLVVVREGFWGWEWEEGARLPK